MGRGEKYHQGAEQHEEKLVEKEGGYHQGGRSSELNPLRVEKHHSQGASPDGGGGDAACELAQEVYLEGLRPSQLAVGEGPETPAQAEVSSEHEDEGQDDTQYGACVEMQVGPYLPEILFLCIVHEHHHNNGETDENGKQYFPC